MVLTMAQQLAHLMLPLSVQEKLREQWNVRVTDPLAFIPHELKGKLHPSRARAANEALGGWAAQCFKAVLKDTTDQERLRRLFRGKKAMALGCGRGYDMDWVPEAVAAGLQAVWLDVSDEACNLGQDCLDSQWRNIEAEGIKHPKPIIKRAEIRTALLQPAQFDLDLDDVEVWYCCRTLGCFSALTAKIVLEVMGQSLRKEADPDKKNRIVIVAAMREHNPNRVSKTSKLYKTGELLAKIRRGAARTVEVAKEATTLYFDQTYSALTIKAK